MIIECKEIYNENTRTFTDKLTDGFITVGCLYNVLEIIFRNNNIYYRINPDGDYFRHPIIVRSNEFDVVTSRIPNNWIYMRRSDTNAILAPKDWIDQSMWVECFWADWDNNLEKAIDSYDKEFEIICACDEDYIQIIKSQRGLI